MPENHEGSGQGRRPTLRIFFGMCTGVGKTHAMLEEAHLAAKGSREVVIGLVETQGQPELEALLSGLEAIPPRLVEARGRSQRELDLDAVLVRRPEIVVIDDLEHANAPGSLHLKRWQDVLELLDRGISVWTAVNVQHVESLADVVEDLAGVAVRDRVPDTVLDRADEIRLIDLAPEDLARRLEEGRLAQAGDHRPMPPNFFRPKTLGALRELSLRFAARAAERRLRSYAREESSLEPKRFADGKILVAVGPSPSSAYLVRWARRTAYALKADWVAVHVDSGRPMAKADQARLEANLELARSLGAETLVIRAQDIAEAVVATAKDQAASMIVLGRSGLSRLGFFPKRATVSDRIVREAGSMAVAVVQDASKPRFDLTLAAARRFLVAPKRQYALLGAVLGLFLLGGWLLFPLIGFRGLSLLYLAAILGLSFVAEPGPMAILAVTSALALNFLFIAPRYTLSIASLDDFYLFATYFLVAFVTSALVARLRGNERIVEEREGRAAFLFKAAEKLAACRTIAEAAETAAALVETQYSTAAAVFVSNQGGGMAKEVWGSGSGFAQDEELDAAAYAFAEGRVAGRGSDSFPAARFRYLPAKERQRSAAVIGIIPPAAASWKRSDDNLLLSLGRTLALVIEREHAESRSLAAAVELESDRLSKVLLDTVSHELRTPLTTIMGSISALTDRDLAAHEASRTALIGGALEAATRLDRIVEDILSMSRIESGVLRLATSVVDLQDLAASSIGAAGPELDRGRLRLAVPPASRPVKIDFALSARLAGNLLRNAARYAPPETAIEFSLGLEGEDLVMRVRDHGPGLPDEELGPIFDRFRRGRNSVPGGLGLGLAICRGIALAHGGTIEAHNAAGGGLEMKVSYPACAIGEEA